MPARAITQDLYEKVLAFYRENPGSLAACARHAGIHVRTARRLWRGPQSKLWPWCVPCQEVILKEKQAQEDARSRVEHEKQAALAKQAARARSLEAEAESFEEKVLAVARADVVAGLASVNQITRGVMALAKRVGEDLERGKDAAGKPTSADPIEFSRLLRGYTSSVRGLTEAADTLINLSRARTELPRVGALLEASSMTLEDATREVDFAQRSLERAKALGLRVVAGGAEGQGGGG